MSSSFSLAVVAMSKRCSHIVRDPVTSKPAKRSENSTHPLAVSTSRTASPLMRYITATVIAPATPPATAAAIMPLRLEVFLRANTATIPETAFAAHITRATAENSSSSAANSADSAASSMAVAMPMR